MKTFGLVGKSLAHSFSQQYFKEKFLQNNVYDAEYCFFSIANIQEVSALLTQPALLGFNVTIPYKTDIIPFLDDIDPIAKEVGAVNCVVKQNNRWVGYNTDVFGFERILQQTESIFDSSAEAEPLPNSVAESNLPVFLSYGLTVSKKAALILGSGGASKAVCYVLKQRKIPFQIVSRTKTAETLTYDEITERIMNHFTFIINTTPLGMFPNVDEMPPILYAALTHNHILIDLIYNPKETLFLKEGKKRGALTINGFEMFNIQAELSYKLFNL